MGKHFTSAAYSVTLSFIFFFPAFLYFFLYFFTLITAMYLNLLIALLMGVIAFATDGSAQVWRLNDEAEHELDALAVDEARQLNEEMEEFEKLIRTWPLRRESNSESSSSSH